MIMTERERIRIQGAEKVIVFNDRYGMGPNMELSIDSDCEPLENVKVLSSTLVKLYFAIAPAYRAIWVLLGTRDSV